MSARSPGASGASRTGRDKHVKGRTDGSGKSGTRKKSSDCAQCSKVLALMGTMKKVVSEMKSKADRSDEYLSQLERSRKQLAAARQEVEHLRQQLGAYQGRSTQPPNARSPPSTPTSRPEAARRGSKATIKVRDAALSGAIGAENSRVADTDGKQSDGDARGSARREETRTNVGRAGIVVSGASAFSPRSEVLRSTEKEEASAKDVAPQKPSAGRAESLVHRRGDDPGEKQARRLEGKTVNEDGSTRLPVGGDRDRSYSKGLMDKDRANGAGVQSRMHKAGGTGVFAATAFSFLEGDAEEGEGGEEAAEEGNKSDDEDGVKKRQKRRSLSGHRSRSSNGSDGRRQTTHKRPRTALASTSLDKRRASSPTPSQSASLSGDEGGRWRREDVDTEVYEEYEGEMGHLGWSDVWRRMGGDVAADVGDGLIADARKLARKHLDMIGKTDFGSRMGPEHLRELLSLAIEGKATAEGILMAVLRGRSAQLDSGIVGHLALQFLDGIDDVHPKPLSDAIALEQVVRELEILAGVLVAASTPAMKIAGWGKETSLAASLLLKALLDWMDQYAQKVVNSGDNSEGFLSMAFGGSKRARPTVDASTRAVTHGPDSGEQRRDTLASGAHDAGDEAGADNGEQGATDGEARTLSWWKVDEGARVPWAAARLLGLLLRQMKNPERARMTLHPILLCALRCPSRLLRMPLAFLEAFPGFLEVEPPGSSSSDAKNASSSRRFASLLRAGLWQRAAATSLFPGGKLVIQSGGPTAVLSRLRRVSVYGGKGGGDAEAGNGDDSSGGDGDPSPGADRGEATRLAEDVLRAVAGVHAEDGGCALCAGDGGRCGADDALALATRGHVERDQVIDELDLPRCQGEQVAVQVVQALRLLPLALGRPWERLRGSFPLESTMEAVFRRKGVCERGAAVVCHVLAQCAGAGAMTERPRGDAWDGMDKRVCRRLRDLVDGNDGNWEKGQVMACVRLPQGAKAQAAVALLSLLRGMRGEIAGEDELCIVAWVQGLKPAHRLVTPLPLLSAVLSVISRPPAHVINLARRTDRWSVAADIARREGVWLHRHQAVDGLKVEASGTKAVSDALVTLTWDSELNTMHDPGCEQGKTITMSPSERACAASHADLWRRHKDGLLAPFMPDLHPDAVLILEDDAELQPGFLEKAKAAMKLVTAADKGRGPKARKAGRKGSSDIVYLGHTIPAKIIAGIVRREVVEAAAAESRASTSEAGGDGSRASTPREGTGVGPDSSSPASILAGSDSAPSLEVPSVTFAWRLHAYLLTREGARRLVNRFPVSAPADIFVASFLSATDQMRPVLAGRAVLPVIAKAAPGVGDVVSPVALRGGGATDGIIKSMRGRMKKRQSAATIRTASESHQAGD